MQFKEIDMISVIILLNEKLVEALKHDMSDIASKLNHRVGWDRYFMWEDEGVPHATLYGWIKREDNFFDYVTLDFHWHLEAEKSMVYFGYGTSSSKYSKEIFDILYPEPLENQEHNECKSAKEIPGLNLIAWQR
jgi:hypothetical protein